MPKCRNCGTRLTKFDTDICPVCGTKEPLKGVSSDTIEVTSEISLDADVAFRVCNKRNMFLFFALLGIFGAAWLYLKRVKTFIIWFAIHALFIVGAFLLLYMKLDYSLIISLACPLVVGYLFNIIFGLVMLFKPNLKDGEGEYVR